MFRHTLPFLLASLLVSCLFLGACKKHTQFFTYQSVNQEGWNCTDTLWFQLDELPHADDDSTLSIDIRYTNRYPYQDLWLVMEQRTDPDSRQRDTIHMDLSMRPNAWQVKGNVLHELDTTATVCHFTQRRTPVKLLVYHIMNEQTLTGIIEIGVRLQ